jgi:hypothetical protein
MIVGFLYVSCRVLRPVAATARHCKGVCNQRDGSPLSEMSGPRRGERLALLTGAHTHSDKLPQQAETIGLA